jgi:hypothetical protein
LKSHRILTIFSEVIDLINNKGEKHTYDLIKSCNTDSFKENLHKYIISQTLVIFNCSEKEIYNNSDRTIEKSDALSVISFLLKKYSGYSNIRIAYLLQKKNRASITNYLHFINNLNDKIKHHKDIKDKITYLEREIKEYKEKYEPKINQ